MLYDAYTQLLKTKKIIGTNENGEEQYVIPQFDVEKAFLSLFNQNIEKAFSKIVGGHGMVIDSSVHIADYDSWHGVKVGVDVCNSLVSFNSLCKVGRLYISEEYGLYTLNMEILQRRVRVLEAENRDWKERDECRRSEKSKVRADIEDLNLQMQQKDAKIESLLAENSKYEAVIETVRGELEKYAKIGKSISKWQDKKSQYRSKNKMDLLKICLLFIILILVILSSLMSYGFFRDFPQTLKKEVSGILKDSLLSKASSDTALAIQSSKSMATMLDAFPVKKDFDSKGGDFDITIETDGEWGFDLREEYSSWITLTKKEKNRLSVGIKENSGPKRACSFMIKAGSFEKQINITQESAPSRPDFGLVVKRDNGQLLNMNDTVVVGEVLTAEATKFVSIGDYGWRYQGCSGTTDNKQNVPVEIQNGTGSVIIAYGPKGYDSSKRERLFLTRKIVTGSSDSSTSRK